MTTEDDKGDKWDTVFRKPGRVSNDARNQRYDNSGDRYESGGSRGQDFRSGGFSSNRFDDSGFDDPRFAGKFGGGSRGGPPLATNSRAESLAGIPTLGMSEIDKKKAAKAEQDKKIKEEKAAKAKAKEEAEAKAKKELEDKKIAEKEREERAKEYAATAFATGKLGDELKSEIENMTNKPSGSALVAHILAGLEDKKSIDWCSKEKYGEALKLLVAENDKEQMKVINEIVKFCNTIDFPKIEVKSGTRPLIEVLFQLLYSLEILDPSGFNMWWDDEDEEETPGRGRSILQTTNFMTWLNEVEVDEDEEDDDDGSLEPPPNNNNINN